MHFEDTPPIGAIGIFDSGVGGLSVLRAIRQQLPQAPLFYVADSGHAPYGERSFEFIEQRSQAIGEFLVRQGACLLVVACNTATAAAVASLRARMDATAVVGVEPGIKPAVEQSPSKRVGVLATPATLASAKFQALVQEHGQGAHLVLQACPGLAAEIERGELDTPALRELVARFTAPMRTQAVDTVVLGCTHYPFIEALIREQLPPSVRIVDTAEAVARQTLKQWLALGSKPPDREALQSPQPNQPPPLKLWTSGPPEHLTSIANRWLALQVTASPML